MVTAIRYLFALLAVVGVTQVVGFGMSTEGLSAAEADKRGCCSHHKGVCGCEEGRAVCCDGALSPTCGC
jgi:hypothetical protein